MKRIFTFLVVISLVLSMSVIAFAVDNTDSENEDIKTVSNVNLTIVIPKQSEKTNETQSDPIDTPESIPIVPKLYPISVYESFDNGIRQIIKTYELADSESPADISRDSFERDGWHYEIADIIKKETASADVREHTKTVTIDTDTKDINAIIKLLAPTIEYKSDDGYAGILMLDINSINVETTGTKKNTFTVSAVREYPHLSSNDTSLVPKTISDGGRTLLLSGVEWRTQTSSTIDYDELPNSYTAIAKYTTTGSKTVITGYTTTAEYKGSISKMVTEKTIYTAIFYGEKIIPEPVSFTTLESEESKKTTLAQPESMANLLQTTIEKTQKSKKFFSIVLIIAGLTFIGGFTFFMRRKKSVNSEIITTKETEKNNEEGDCTK